MRNIIFLKCYEIAWKVSLTSATSSVTEVHHKHAHTVNTDIPDIFKNVYRLIPVSSQPSHIWMSILSLFIEHFKAF